MKVHFIAFERDSEAVCGAKRLLASETIDGEGATKQPCNSAQNKSVAKFDLSLGARMRLR